MRLWQVRARTCIAGTVVLLVAGGCTRAASPPRTDAPAAALVRVRSLIPTFEQWRGAARSLPQAERAALYRRVYLAAHPDVFGPVFPVPTDRALTEFLTWLAPREDSALVLSRQITAAIPEAVARLTRIFPSMARDTIDVVVGVGFMSNGTVRRLQGRTTLFLGPDVHTIVDASVADPLMLIGHELVHVVHARRNPVLYGLVEDALRRQPSPLYASVFAEGLATWVSGRVAPGRPLGARLLSNELAAAAPAAAARLWPVLNAELTSTDVRRYGDWFFLGGRPSEIPARFAYWAGDTIVATLAQHHSPDELLRRTPDEVLRDLREVIGGLMRP
ncbi:MAG: hypothetical protein HY275_05200 [Gemmatimonadetes bacterium]|nr:hypothetical protein [Gemmatimonadota bacterium]